MAMAMESKGRPDEVTVEKVLEELNRLKKKHHKDRMVWEEERKELADKDTAMRRRLKEAEAIADAAKDRPPKPDELVQAKARGLRTACDLLRKLKAKHVGAANKWADLTGKQRADSPREVRIWAHPFVGHVLDEAVSAVQELKGELDGHGTEKESGAG
jgi:hypothetical protein